MNQEIGDIVTKLSKALHDPIESMQALRSLSCFYLTPYQRRLLKGYKFFHMYKRHAALMNTGLVQGAMLGAQGRQAMFDIERGHI